MKLKPFLYSTCLLIFMACNNSSDKKDTRDDTARMDNPPGDHTHVAPSGEVPELPAVPDGSKVYFVNLKDGEKVDARFKVVMGVDKIRIDTAGPVVAGSGHHHLIIDGTPLAPGDIVPMDSTHIHFGKGQTETEITLRPGKHSLTLQFADGLHRSYGEKMAATINVNVKK